MTCVEVVCELCTHIKKYVYQSCVFWKILRKNDCFFWIQHKNLPFHTNFWIFFSRLFFWNNFRSANRFRMSLRRVSGFYESVKLLESMKNIRKIWKKHSNNLIIKSCVHLCIHRKKYVCNMCYVFENGLKLTCVCYVCDMCYVWY